MKFHKNWLTDFIDLNLDSSQIAKQLTNIGLEVESIQGDIIEIAIPANRADCFGMRGIARELAAKNNLKLKALNIPSTPYTSKKAEIVVSLQAPLACPRYAGQVISGINAKATTPEWMSTRLIAAGINIISPVVDVTNYVMFELSQPLHAFDLAKIHQQLFVRYAKQDEQITLLDDSEVKLDTSSLIIADSKKPLALAGIMGGSDSAVSADTTDIFLESAYFEPIGIRNSSKKHQIQTDSSMRFERAIDPNLCKLAISRASELIIEICGGQPSEVVVFEDQHSLPACAEITLDKHSIYKLLGISPSEQQIADIFSGLELEYQDLGNKYQINVPAHRRDLEQAVDLIEEIGRMVGYDNVPSIAPEFTNTSIKPNSNLDTKIFAQTLAALGYHEAICYSFIDPNLASLFHKDGTDLILSNPISQDMSAMRQSLLPGLINAAKHNLHRQHSRVKLFEVGNRYYSDDKQNQALMQIPVISGVCAGEKFAEGFMNKKEQHDFYQVKDDVIKIAKLANLKLKFAAAQVPGMHPGQTAKIFVNQQYLGFIGALHPSLHKQLSINCKLIAFELDLTMMQNNQRITYQAISKFPKVRRDLALIIDANISAIELQETIANTAGNLLKNVIIFDIYQGKEIPEGSKSIALGIELQSTERTLTDTEVNQLIDKVTNELGQTFQAKLRL